MTINGVNKTQQYAARMVNAIRELLDVKNCYADVLHQNGVSLAMAEKEAERLYEESWKFVTHIEDGEEINFN